MRRISIAHTLRCFLARCTGGCQFGLVFSVWLVCFLFHCSLLQDIEVLFLKTKRWCGHGRTTVPAVALSVGLALGVVGGKEGLCPPPYVPSDKEASVQEFLTWQWRGGGRQELFTESFEMLAKTIDHLSRKMHQTHQILHNQFQNGLLKTSLGPAITLRAETLSFPLSLLGSRGGPEPGEPSTQ